jgi:arylsulfatase A-like enzyme
MTKQFKGVIKLDIRDSKPDWTPYELKKAPAGAPNILVVLYDDTGLASWSLYGGRINMPTLQKLADNGLMYSQWHTTALCSPTRSTFLTGRNHHLNRCASITEATDGFPGAAGAPRRVRHYRSGASGEWLQHLLVGKESQRPH